MFHCAPVLIGLNTDLGQLFVCVPTEYGRPYRFSFLRATAVPAGTAESAYQLWRFCPSVRPSRPGTDSRPGEIETPYDSQESLVSYEIIWCHWVRRLGDSPRTRASKRGTPAPSEIVILVVVVVVVVVNGSYSAAPYSSPDRECITKVTVKHRRSTQKKVSFEFALERANSVCFAEIYWRQTKTTCVRS